MNKEMWSNYRKKSNQHRIIRKFGKDPWLRTDGIVTEGGVNGRIIKKNFLTNKIIINQERGTNMCLLNEAKFNVDR